ncbi:MAG: hypothetical protein JWP68_4090, partial [Modestobacter sp.]|nr:hypothetical protein [Modestobacter sp.]
MALLDHAGDVTPAVAHPMVGANLALAAGADVELPLEPDVEDAALTATA